MTLDKLKKAINDKKLKYGTDETLKAIRKGQAKIVFISSNCPDELRLRIEKYGNVVGFDLVKLEINNEELGAVCKKPFTINMCYSF